MEGALRTPVMWSPPTSRHLPTAHSPRRVLIGSYGIRAGQSLHIVLWDRWDGGDILSP